MSDYTLVQFGAMQTGQQDLVNSLNNLQSTVDQLDSQLQSHLASWTGSAQQAYLVAKQTWTTAMADMGTVLQSLGAVVGTAGENYTAAERANTSMFS
jgi:WXG100 family type VII secretion target